MTHINQRRDYASNWATANPILQDGEVGWEKDTRRAKLGDGFTPWNDLDYNVVPLDTLTKEDIGLGNVDNTSDMDKPVSTPQSVLLAPKESPILTGDPRVPTPSATSSTFTVPNTSWVWNRVTGAIIHMGDVSGTVNIAAAVTAAGVRAQNAVITMTLVGNTTIAGANLPIGGNPTRFTVRVKQDSVGGRLLGMTNVLRPGGALTVSSAPNAQDVIDFFRDGGNLWFAAFMGKGFQ